MASTSALTNYDCQADNFSKLPEYSVTCGTDYLAVKDAPRIIKQITPAKKILDLGCGTGLATRYLKKHFPDAVVIGADINQTMLAQAAIADPDGVYLHLEHVNQQICYPFTANFFDVVVCSFMLHENQTLEALTTLIKHIATMLRPKGLLLAWDAYKNLFCGKWTSIKTLFPQNIIEDAMQYKVQLLPSNAEVIGTYWSPETIKTIAQSVGFSDSQIHYPLAEPDIQVRWLDETKLAPVYVFEARKIDG